MELSKPKPDQLSLRDIWRGLRTVYGYAAEQKKDFKPLIFATVTLAIVSAFQPYIWGLLVDSITHRLNNTEFFLSPVGALGVWFVIVVTINILDWFKGLRARKIEEIMRAMYRVKLHQHLMLLPISYHVHHKSGETQEKISRAANGMYEVLTQTILDNLPQVFTLVIMLGLVFSISVPIGIITLVGFTISTLLSFRNLRPMARYQKEMQLAFKEAFGKIADGVSNFRTIKDFNTEGYEYRKVLSEFVDKALPSWWRLHSKGRGNSFAQGVIASVTRLVAYSVALYYIFNGSMTLGQMVTLSGLINFGPITILINTRYRLQNALISVEDAEAILNTPTEVYLPANQAKMERLKGNVEFKDVSFSYDGGENIFERLSFNVKSGETIAFVGESGVGKSTLIDLILGHYFPSQGEICYDGIDNRRISLDTIRQNIGLVPQEVTLFNDTVFNNIRYGSFDASEEEVREAARKAHCVEFIDKFPLKWDQLVGERGMKLSVGQKQRIAIARAFLKDPSILVLDEPTSALDARSEKEIIKSVEKLLKGRTTFIVAHRLSTVRKADRILVFKNGKLVEDGNHDELLAKGKEYAKLYNLQSQAV